MTETVGNTRPIWSRKDISEDDARWFMGHAVRRIGHGWAMTGADTSEHWLELHAKDDLKDDPRRITHLPECVRFTPNHHWQLLELDRWVAGEVGRLDDWDKTHARDIAELKRLKKKLYGTNA